MVKRRDTNVSVEYAPHLDHPVLFLLAGMLEAVPAPLHCRRQAFTCQNIAPRFRVFAVPFAAVPCAGLPLGAHHHVGAAAKHALACTSAVFCAEALDFRGGGAARHGARLLLSAEYKDSCRSLIIIPFRAITRPPLPTTTAGRTASQKTTPRSGATALARSRLQSRQSLHPHRMMLRPEARPSFATARPQPALQ